MKSALDRRLRRTAAGFTLIELVIVITIVGILAAVALPRFVNLQRDARIAKAQSIFGTIRSAAALAKARCEADLAIGVTTGCITGVVNMDGAAVQIVNRYPAATADGIDLASQILASDGMTITGGGTGARTYDIVGAATPGQCQISYTAAAANAAPVVTLDWSGC